MIFKLFQKIYQPPLFAVILSLKYLKVFPRVLSVPLSTMKISDEQLDKILRPGVVQLSKLFQDHGYEIRVAGGAVRDLLMGKIPTDLDFATTATPTEMKAMFEANEIRMINLGGEKHGTITARLEDENFECTTLRIDKVTDGRHAEVEFIKNWELDAGRRDLTINALFLGLDGTVFDYFDGGAHIKDRRVLFVGDCSQRLQEDYLRILRYFRFYGRVAESPDNHDQYTVECIKKHANGLTNISGERIWVEVRKIVCGRFGENMLDKLVEWGVGKHIGLPDDFDVDNVYRVYENCHNAGIDPLTMNPCSLLASGFKSESQAITFINRIKSSNKEKDILTFIINHRDSATKAKDTKYVIDFCVDLIYREKRAKHVADSVMRELLLYTARMDLLQEFEGLVVPRFPVNGNHIVDHVKKKKEMKVKLEFLLNLWQESNYTMDRDELINSLKNDS